MGNCYDGALSFSGGKFSDPTVVLQGHFGALLKDFEVCGQP